MFRITDEIISDSLAAKERLLVENLRTLASVVVAYSGGVDSSLLAYYAKVVLEAKAEIAIAVSPSLADDDLEAARAQASLFDWRLIEINTDEFDTEDYTRNDDMRCFYCKATLFEELIEIAGRRNIKHIVYGANLDDHSDYRPGRMAATRYSVVAPLEEAGLGKDEIRTLARRAGLPSWDRPQNACLSSRIPANITVTVDNVKQVESAESFVKSLGFKVVRVRHFGDRAVVEVGLDELNRFKLEPCLVNKIETGLSDLGFDHVTIDPRGYRQGALSHAPAAHQATPTISGSFIRS